MIDRGGQLSVKRQAQLLDLSRSSVYYEPQPISERDLQLMRRIDELHLEAPFYGARKLAKQLQREGHEVGRRHVGTLMRRMGVEALYRKPRTSIPARGATVYPYLLEGMVIDRPNQVWASDLTYLPMAHGFMYLVAILDVASRKVLAWRLSNTMTADFCVEALEEAMSKFGCPEIFNTDQGSQFTSEDWTAPLKVAGVSISMDGKGRWIGRVGDWRGKHTLRGVAVGRHCRCLSPRCISRFQSPLVEPDVQISRIRLSYTRLRPSRSSRLRGFWEAGRGRAFDRGTRSDIADIRCLAYPLAATAIASGAHRCSAGGFYKLA